MKKISEDQRQKSKYAMIITQTGKSSKYSSKIYLESYSWLTEDTNLQSVDRIVVLFWKN